MSNKLLLSDIKVYSQHLTHSLMNRYIIHIGLLTFKCTELSIHLIQPVFVLYL